LYTTSSFEQWHRRNGYVIQDNDNKSYSSHGDIWPDMTIMWLVLNLRGLLLVGAFIVDDARWWHVWIW